ncbi:MAG: response regulator [Deltaproteobacteria bacterium]|nr:response regulator [Deltaproteobacteria bacterium]
MPTRLLIADDSTTIQKVFERTFPPEEFALTFANNGEEALDKARKDKPDLVIADINMPLKNGFEVCEEVKKDPLLKGTPVLLLIGILDDFDEDESHRVGADGFIVKPFEANAAITKVQEALTKRAEAPPLEEAVEEALPLEEVVVGKEEEVLELEEVVEEPAAAAAPPPQEKPEEGVILETPLKELEAELQQEFPGEEEEEKEEPLSLDLPLDAMESEPIVEGAEGPSLFGDLGVEEAEKETKAERLETILGESATELERIEGLAPKEEKEEFEERFAEAFEPVFEAKEEGLKKVGVPEKGLEEVLKEAMGGLAEKLAAALGQELRETVKEVLKETVPKLVRQEIERSRKG